MSQQVIGQPDVQSFSKVAKPTIRAISSSVGIFSGTISSEQKFINEFINRTGQCKFFGNRHDLFDFVQHS